MSLVGEKERKLLKEIVKSAKTPVKSRIVPPGKNVFRFFFFFLTSGLFVWYFNGVGFKISCCFSSSEVIEKYKGKIQGLDKDLKDILKQESEEKEVGDSQTYNKNLQGNRAISEISLNT